VRVVVERNGKPQELTLNMAQVASELPESAGVSDGLVPMDQAEPMPPNPTEEQ
jgi:hypothetical protein